MQVSRGNAEIRVFRRLEKYTRKYDISSSEICRVHSLIELSQGTGFTSGKFPSERCFSALRN